MNNQTVPSVSLPSISRPNSQQQKQSALTSAPPAALQDKDKRDNNGILTPWSQSSPVPPKTHTEIVSHPSKPKQIRVGAGTGKIRKSKRNKKEKKIESKENVNIIPTPAPPPAKSYRGQF